MTQLFVAVASRQFPFGMLYLQNLLILLELPCAVLADLSSDKSNHVGLSSNARQSTYHIQHNPRTCVLP